MTASSLIAPSNPHQTTNTTSFASQRKGISSTHELPTTISSSSSSEDEDEIKKKKKVFFKRTSYGSERIRKTARFFLSSLLVLFVTWKVTNPSHGHNRKTYRDDRFHQKIDKEKKHYLKRDPQLREERKRRAQEREEFNRIQNQKQYQQKQQLVDKKITNSKNNGGGGVFDYLLHSITNNNDNERMKLLKEELNDLDQRIYNNENRGIRWINMQLVPSLQNQDDRPLLDESRKRRNKVVRPTGFANKEFFTVKRRQRPSSKPMMGWEQHDKDTIALPTRDNFVDYTKHNYEYPTKLMEPLGEYPKLTPLKELMEIWPQDELDHPPAVIHEALIHFDYTIPQDLEAAEKFRDAKLPFKMINVPEVVAAGEKWTDEYVSSYFDGGGGPPASGTAQESPDNYFAWYQPSVWDVESMGLPPVRNNDWTYAKWAQHARYADRVGLDPNQPHFYWQSGVDREERYEDERDWTFISQDLPSFSATTENFFLFEPKEQKGIQCRFGERGVTAATHFDGGRNMVAMMTGAKRYILSPPRECGKLGIVTTRSNPIFRHSLLNFGHLNHMNDPSMPQEEREWLEVAGTADALSTVLKAGEVLYIPSHWFHYITSVQKSAQCNVRSGIDRLGDAVFGGESDVTAKCFPGGAM